MTLLYSKFQIFSSLLYTPPPRTITTTPSINWNWEMLIISNYYKPPISDFNMKCQPLYYLPPSPSAIRVLSIDSPDLNQNSDDII